MNNTQVIDVYEDLLVVTEQMLQVARNGNWEQLVALENRCKTLIEGLMAAGPRDPLGGQLQQRKVEIVQKVLADDARISNITEPWMEQVHRILSADSPQRKTQLTSEPGSDVKALRMHAKLIPESP